MRQSLRRCQRGGFGGCGHWCRRWWWFEDGRGGDVFSFGVAGIVGFGALLFLCFAVLLSLLLSRDLCSEPVDRVPETATYGRQDKEVQGIGCNEEDEEEQLKGGKGGVGCNQQSWRRTWGEDGVPELLKKRGHGVEAGTGQCLPGSAVQDNRDLLPRAWMVVDLLLSCTRWSVFYSQVGE